ncbi:hypothetical protein RFI_20501 [Reticulomyxa filosa]|uniref:Uncharacterized protein n=1 Tax=Reticulomyxa filosa TaxID=46433 RepID=X6MSM9_RETFI|nr:hypothetical protein RFI_20501 [Reticulomyxa filosa]|eukprot:ETO16839.1 hypothetical protein RFI_20501 [Reticulomyxa filosa]
MYIKKKKKKKRIPFFQKKKKEHSKWSRVQGIKLSDFSHVWPYSNNIYTQMLSGSFTDAYYNEKYLKKHYRLPMTYYEHLYVVQGVAINKTEEQLYETPIEMPHPLYRVLRQKPPVEFCFFFFLSTRFVTLSPNQLINQSKKKKKNNSKPVNMVKYPNVIAYLRHEMDIVRSHLLMYEHFLLARHHLLQMSWIGLTETFDESMDQLSVLWGLCSNMGGGRINANTNKWYVKQQHNKDSNGNDSASASDPKKRTEFVTAQELQDIAKYNVYDVHLYQLSKVLYLQQELVILTTKLDGKKYQCSVGSPSRLTFDGIYAHHVSLSFLTTLKKIN